jgi:hypothetical protein
MKVRLYRPVGVYLIELLGNDRGRWETQLSTWAGFQIKLPKYFWEIHLFVINKRTPRQITVECNPEKDWFSIFYSYNLNGDLKKYVELTMVRKCRRHREEAKWKKMKRVSLKRAS